MKTGVKKLVPLFVFLAACVISVAYSVVNFTILNKQRSFTNETVDLLYDGASKGVDPDGNDFDPSDFLTSKVIAQGLKDANLSSTYSVEDISSNLLIKGVVPENIIDNITSFDSFIGGEISTRDIKEKEYHPTKYNFVLYHDFDEKISEENSKLLLEKIVDAYIASFQNFYMMDYDISSYSGIYDTTKSDFFYQIDTYKVRLNVISRYATSIYNIHKDFSVEGKTFNDIALKCNSLLDNEVSRIDQSISLNALSTDIQTLKDYFTFLIIEDNYELAKLEEDLQEVNKQIASYDKDSTLYISGGESIIKVDSNSKETYDALLTHQINLSSSIAALNREISDYQSRLDNINKSMSGGNDSALNNLKKNLLDLDTEYKAVEDMFKSFQKAYNAKYISSNSISHSDIKYTSSSLFSMAFVISTIKIALPICGITLIGIALYYLVREVKKYRLHK